MTIELTVAISVVCTVIGALLGVAGYHRSSDRDVADSARKNGAMVTEIGYMKSDVDTMKAKQNQLSELLQSMAVELAEGKISLTQLSQRMDKVEGKRCKEENQPRQAD